MLINNIILQLLGMLLDKLARGQRIYKGILNTSTQKAFKTSSCLLTQRLRGNDRTQRQRQTHTRLPLKAEVGNEFQVTAMIDKPSLVNQHAAIKLTALHSLGNIREEHGHTLLNLGEEPTHKPICGGMLTRYCDAL